jgi:hypothetical protein
MQLNSRVKVLTPHGRFTFATHRAHAEGMLLEGSAVYESPRLIRLTCAVRTTPEMYLTPRVEVTKARRADSSHGDAGRVDVVRAAKTLSIPNGPVVREVVPGTFTEFRRREVV